MIQREAIELYLKQITKTGFNSDDTPKTRRGVLRLIKSIIVTFKQRALNDKSISINEFDKITLCVKLKKVDRTVDLPQISASNSTWHRSVDVLPRAIKINKITDVGGFLDIDIIEWQNVKKRENIRLESLKSKPIAALKYENNGVHLFVKLPGIKDWDSCLLEMIPEDYYQALIFPKCGEVDKKALCNPLDTPMGTSDSIIQQAIDYLTKKEAPIVDIKDNDNSVQ